nr:DNA polymerase III, alpha subunit [Tanacetum cinerariifolium]
FGFANDQFYFKSQAEMNELFSDVPESVDNTNEIVDKITPPKLARDILLPNFPLPPQFANADEFLRELTYVGAFGPEAGNGSGRSMGVAVGPGRGSAAGSAVAYCVGITNIDPIKYSLLFERFLNPERVSMPDIDIDFDDVNRQKVIDYVFIPDFINRKHGREPVEYPHELLKPILEYSQGIMVYQEQIMQTAQILAGYSLGGADLLRRAMGKKDMKKMALERD